MTTRIHTFKGVNMKTFKKFIMLMVITLSMIAVCYFVYKIRMGEIVLLTV
jgi:hypothetical protein